MYYRSLRKMTKKEATKIFDYEIEPVEVDLTDFTIELEDIRIDPILKPTAEEIEYHERYTNMTADERKQELKKTFKEFNLQQIKMIKQRKKELPKQIEETKRIKKNLTKQYEENPNKELKKTIKLFERIIKGLENSYNNSDKQIKQLMEYIE